MFIFLVYCFFCAVFCLYFFVLQVRFIIGDFSENGLKRWRNQELGEKVEVDREQHSFDRDQAEVRELEKCKGSRSVPILIAIKSKSETSDFEVDRDQGHLLIAIKDGKIRVFCRFRFLNVNFKWKSYISILLTARNPRPS